MRQIQFTVVVSVVFAAAALFAVVGTAATPGDELWDGRFFVPGLESYGYSVAVDDAGNIYVGGLFKAADDQLVNGVAVWDGSRWSPLGDGLNSAVQTLAFDDSGLLYAGGNFSDAGGDSAADRIAVWDGFSWSALANHTGGLNGRVTSIAFDSLGRLIAGGWFTDAGGDPDADRIAVWDGSQWSSLGGAGTGIGGTVNSVAVSSSGILVIGGNFTDAGGNSTADYIAGWNGSAWSPLGGGLNGTVNDLHFAAHDVLYVAGSFTDAGGDPDADRIAVWDSPTWSSVGGTGSGLNSVAYAVGLDGSGNLFVGGSFTDAGGDPEADKVARWTGTAWAAMDATSRCGLNSTVNDLAFTSSDDLIAVGAFRNAGNDPDANHVAVWEAGDWQPLSDASLPGGFGLDGDVTTLAIGPNGRLFAGGDFDDAGGHAAADSIAVLEDTGWQALGTTEAIDGYVYAIAFLDNGDVVAGGDFYNAAGDPDADYIAVWDGFSWSSLGGPGSGLYDPVRVLAVGPDGNLYAGGTFFDAGNDPDADGLAVWDGVTWSSLDGANGSLGGSAEVWDLTFDDAGNLYVVGYFDDAGGVSGLNNIAVWNGGSWQHPGGPGGAGLDGVAYTLAFDDQGTIYVGGDGVLYDSGTHHHVVKWDGSGWAPLGDGLNDIVWDLVFDGSGTLFAAGQFDPSTADPLHPREIAMWDGVQWSGLGSGLDDDAFALAYDGGFNVYVGGVIDTAGGKPSARIGCYTGATPAGLIFADGFESNDTTAWSSTAR